MIPGSLDAPKKHQPALKGEKSSCPLETCSRIGINDIKQYGDCIAVPRKAERCHGVVVWEGTRNLQEDTGRRSSGCGKYIQQYGECTGVPRKAGRCHGVVVWEGTRNLQEDTGRRSSGCGKYIQQYGECTGVPRKAGRCHGVV
jgi:hypothetical protein